MNLTILFRRRPGVWDAVIFSLLALCILVFSVSNVYKGELWPHWNPNSSMIDLRFLTRKAKCETSNTDLYEMHEVCDCDRARRPLLVPSKVAEVASTCSVHATARGFRQKVVSYSFYGVSTKNEYFSGTMPNVVKVAELYPGWVMRLYHNISVQGLPEERAALCDVWCSNDHVDLCDVRHLPADLCDQTKVFGMIWRFFTLGDPLVERFLIRDLDSYIYQREVDSVNTWIQENKTWHVMRDHPYHSVPMLGGMWSATNWDTNLTLSLRESLIANGNKWEKGSDQALLSDIVWPHAATDVTSHDSFYCQYFKESSPFPTQRINGDFVGNTFPWEEQRFKITQCPVECRPRDHLDWEYC